MDDDPDAGAEREAPPRDLDRIRKRRQQPPRETDGSQLVCVLEQ